MSPSSPALCKGLRSSSALASLRLEEETKKQGIGSILGLSEEKQRAPGRRGSLRRTLSADMSSRKWLAQMGSPEEKGKPEREETEPPKQLDLWSSIVSQNGSSSSSSAAVGAPYVHPLVRRSASWLSEKSLEVCTESLGSETGSDGFSSSSEDFDYSPSDVSEDEEEGTEQEEEVRLPKKELGAVNYNCSVSRRSPPRSFPPPLPSISRRDGPCLQMRPHRKDGRLVLEAVPVTSQTYLHAEREGGRLRLTFVNALTRNQASQAKSVDPHEEEAEEEMENSTEDREEQEEEIEEAAYVDRGVDIPRKEAVGSREMKVHRAAEMLTKFMGVPVKNPDPWKGKKSQEEEGILPVRCLARSSPAPAMLNTYECWWRAGAARQLDLPPLPKKPLLMNAEELLHARRCKEARRPLVVWAPRCIATT
ncbi:hypothetical protein ACLOJK_013890 [Asimina triloba]